MRRATVWLAACVLLVSCGPPPGASNHPSQTLEASASRSTGPTGSGSNPKPEPQTPPVAVGALGVTVVLNPPAYTVSVITAAGRVLAWALATLPASPSSEQCSAPGCNRMAYPLTSTSDSRVYFLDGDTTVKYLTPTGQTGQATTISAGPKTLAAFSVSPDDRRIAVSLMDYSALPSGKMSLQLYAEDLGGGNRVNFFSAKGIVEWPIGWRSGQLVLAVGGGADAAAANPYDATEYHIVNPANGDRIAVIGHPSGAPGATCNYGPVVSAGTACVSDTPGETYLGVEDWNGNYTESNRYRHMDKSQTLALSPNGSTLAVGLGGTQGLVPHRAARQSVGCRPAARVD